MRVIGDVGLGSLVSDCKGAAVPIFFKKEVTICMINCIIAVDKIGKKSFAGSLFGSIPTWANPIFWVHKDLINNRYLLRDSQVVKASES